MANPQLNPRQIFPSSNYPLQQAVAITGINTQVPNLPFYGNNIKTRDHEFAMFGGPEMLSPNEVMYRQDQIRFQNTNQDLGVLQKTYSG
jgi:hypothetical protein